MANKIRTSKRLGRLAGKTLGSKKSSKKLKSLAGGVLSNRRK